jgi:hypothetical protein
VIAEADDATYNPGTLTETTVYTREAKDGLCNTTFAASSGSWTVTVRPQFTTGTISSTGEIICYGADAGVIGSTTAASGGNGSITYQWKADGVVIAEADDATYNPGTLTETTVYTREAKDGLCNTTFAQSTGSWTVTVNPLPTAVISGTTAVCFNGTAPSVTFTGSNGTAPYTFTYKIGTGSNQTVTTTSGNSVTVSQPTGTVGTFVYTLLSVQDNSSTKCSNTVSNQSATITVSPTVLCVQYNGDYFVNTTSTGTGGSAVVTVTYNITATGTCSNISGLSASDFIITPDADANVQTVTLVEAVSYTNGVLTAKYNILLKAVYSGTVGFTLSLGTPSNYTIPSTCSDNPLVTVSAKTTDFVTGGGYIIPINSGGTPGKTIGGAEVNGLKNNFGFNIKYNKGGKLQGNWNTTIRRREGDKVVVYQVKSNTAASYVVTKMNTIPVTYRADMTFTSANFKNLTCELCPVDANNGTVIVTVFDNGEPGKGVDKILITIKDRSGNVWYTSDKGAAHSPVTNTGLQLLNGGNIQIHTAVVAKQSASEQPVTIAKEEVQVLTTFSLRAFPNPTTSHFKLHVESENSKEKINLRVMDLSGRTVELHWNVTAGQTIQLGNKYRPGMYIVEMIQGNKRKQLKLLKQPD